MDPKYETAVTELARYLRVFPDDQFGLGGTINKTHFWLQDYLNNFHMHFSDPLTGKGFFRTLRQMAGHWDETYGTFFSNSSEVLKKQTPRQFYNLLDGLFVQEKIPMDRIMQLQKENDRKNELLFHLTPVYDRLRSLGYKLSDLNR